MYVWTPAYQRWAPALLPRICAFALISAKLKKERDSAKKKERENKQNRRARKKKALICAFSSPHCGNPVSEPKAAGQRESKDLE
jgi:hypothetical protein